MSRLLLACLAMACSSCGTVCAAPPSDLDVLQRAESAYDRGIAALASGDDAARPAFAESAAAYAELAEARGVRNAALLANLGNAYTLAGDSGRAVLAYRRAMIIDPGNAAARAGLEFARTRVATAVDPSARPWDWVSGWKRVVSATSLLASGALAWALGWITLALHRLGRGGALSARSGATAVVLSIVTAGLVLSDRAVSQRWPEAVVMADGVIGRKGPGGAAYAPSFDAPLAAGLELTLLEDRGQWLRVRLADGRETWVPASSVERV
jgi:tetratricopeptide (TPR) repeat protein